MWEMIVSFVDIGQMFELSCHNVWLLWYVYLIDNVLLCTLIIARSHTCIIREMLCVRQYTWTIYMLYYVYYFDNQSVHWKHIFAWFLELSVRVVFLWSVMSQAIYQSSATIHFYPSSLTVQYAANHIAGIMDHPYMCFFSNSLNNLELLTYI